MGEREETAERLSRLSRIRGLLLGLGAGDSLVRPPAGTATSQLACATVDGLIRAHMRGSHRGIWHPPSHLWRAYLRWERRRAGSDAEADEGWLGGVPQLRVDRGAAPALVAALRANPGLEPRPTTGTSGGHHALTRLLPCAAMGPEFCATWGREIVAATHGDEAAIDAAVRGATLVAQAARADGPAGLLDGIPAAGAAGLGAVESLNSGLHLVASLPSRDTVGVALARAAGLGEGVAPFVGALLGAAHGVEALPVDVVSRMELAWVLDTLARDLVCQLTDLPDGAEYQEVVDPHWRARYPGG